MPEIQFRHFRLAQKPNSYKKGELTVANKKKNINLGQRPIRRMAPIFILPTFLAFAIGFVWPFIQGIYLSFCNFNTPKDAEWVGIANYLKAFKDAGFVNAFWNTASFAVVSIILINVIAFSIAYALTQKIKGSNLFRTVFFMPNLIGGIVLGYIWNILINCLLSLVGSPLLALNTTAGYWGMIVLMCWQQSGYMMIIYIAGLQAIPNELIEAARIDGANARQTLFQVKIPNVMPSITICMFLTLSNGFKLFDQNLALTGGYPYIINPDGTSVHTTEMLALNIYNTFYGQNTGARGVAQAKAVLFFILVAGLSILQLRATRDKEVAA